MIKKICIILSVLIFVLAFPFSCFADNGDSNEDPNTTVTVETSTLRITAASTTGLQSLILSLIGDYEPIVKDYTYTTTSYNGTTTTNHSIEIQPDYSWIASACIFALVVWCSLRFLGGLFSKV